MNEGVSAPPSGRDRGRGAGLEVAQAIFFGDMTVGEMIRRLYGTLQKVYPTSPHSCS